MFNMRAAGMSTGGPCPCGTNGRCCCCGTMLSAVVRLRLLEGAAIPPFPPLPTCARTQAQRTIRSN